MNDNSIMPFGKYKGEKLANVPAWYLISLKDDGVAYGALLHYINENEDVLRAEKKDDETRKKTK